MIPQSGAWWLHARGQPGDHVPLRRPNKQRSERRVVAGGTPLEQEGPTKQAADQARIRSRTSPLEQACARRPGAQSLLVSASSTPGSAGRRAPGDMLMSEPPNWLAIGELQVRLA